MELVGDEGADVARTAGGEGEVGDDLGGRTHDGRVGVDRGVAGQQSDLVGAEHGAQLEELLADERLDGCGVDRALAAAAREVQRTRRDE